MKKLFILLFIFGFNYNLFSQIDYGQNTFEKRNCITIGILQGGGSLVGVDFESLITQKVGLQFGFGFVGFGGALNYHFKPTVRSSFLSLTYWNQGVGESFTQNLFGATYVFRGKKWFTFQIGLGFPISKGPAWPDDFEQTPAMLLYSIGGYIPL
ncbi:MAG: hypothetical protein HN704_18155 [Bacteroidetes bacterium]|jgi:hypothetical protein|nr:hypothetical protein [Bacteroidota bacterium]MBT6686521.1 hypothetical protein [Bacteroidota bacterium]MBT7143416.1 hypothetical protein [Bacteroidota bacterium]MBT7493526.1 hypothetical protein [Bacteroidota bacterium]